MPEKCKNIHAKGIRKGELTMTNREAYERDCEELEQYRAIGTVEECREAVEKQKPKKIIIKSYCPTVCPTCGNELSTSLGDGYYKHPTFL